jgi:hypothetical protein
VSTVQHAPAVCAGHLPNKLLFGQGTPPLWPALACCARLLHWTISRSPALQCGLLVKQPTEFRDGGARVSVAHSGGAGALARGVTARASSKRQLICSGVPRLKPNRSHLRSCAIQWFLESSGPKQAARRDAEPAATLTMPISRMGTPRYSPFVNYFGWSRFPAACERCRAHACGCRGLSERFTFGACRSQRPIGGTVSGTRPILAAWPRNRSRTLHRSKCESGCSCSASEAAPTGSVLALPARSLPRWSWGSHRAGWARTPHPDG